MDEIKKQNSFLIYHDDCDILLDLDDEELAQIFRAIIFYETQNITPDLPKNLRYIFLFIKKNLDKNREKYFAKVAKNRENGMRGGRPPGRSKPKKPTGLIGLSEKPKKTERLISKPKKPDNDNDNDNDIDNDKDNEIDKDKEKDKKIKDKEKRDISNDISAKKKKKDSVAGATGGAKAPQTFIKPTILQILQYCEERGNNVDPESFYDFYESKNWFIGKNKMKNWQAAVRTWERNDYKTKTKKRDIDDLAF